MSPSSQYVYPVKSLLTGVQAGHDALTQPESKSKRKKKRTKSRTPPKDSPNFRHFPAEVNSSTSFSRFPGEHAGLESPPDVLGEASGGLREAGMDQDLAWNPSLLGLVHLPPAPEPATPAEGDNSTSGGSSHEESTSGTATSDSSAYVTVKFQHVEDEHGHHVVLGREGKLQKCEDEVRSIIDLLAIL